MYSNMCLGWVVVASWQLSSLNPTNQVILKKSVYKVQKIKTKLMPVSIQATEKLSWPFAAIANFPYALKIKGLFCILNVVFFMLHLDFYKIHQLSNKDHCRLWEANFL